MMGTVRSTLAATLVIGCASTEPDERSDPDLRLGFERITTDVNLGAITDLQFLPESRELLVLTKDGTVFHLDARDDEAHMLGSFVVPRVYSDLDCGLVSLALDPGFLDNGLVYFGHCLDATQSTISRIRFTPSDPVATAQSAVEILRAGDILADRPWHNIGSIGFDDSGAMWALLGDKTVANNGQSIDDALGAVVRIVPSREPGRGGHNPAPDNPWQGARDRDADVVAIGLRSPWRGALDERGRLWIGDVGAEAHEEIDVLDGFGANFGWPIHEGPCTAGAASCAEFVDPVAHWPHADPSRYVDEDEDATTSLSRAAWVARPQRGGLDDPYDGRLRDRMLVGDFCVGFIRALRLGHDGELVDDVAIGHLAHASAWSQAPDGHLWAATYGSCDSAPAGEDPPTGALWRAVLE